MKILKVYDKINRTVFESNANTGTVFIKEYTDEDEYFCVIINTRVFKTKKDRISYLSYTRYKSGNIMESLDLTRKYIYYKSMNEKGLLIHSDRIHLKDNKAVLTLDRIYDELNNFIELENHRGIRTVKFKIKKEIINNFLNTKNYE